MALTLPCAAPPQITCLTSANEELSAKLGSTTAAKAELLARLTALTDKWRKSVISNDQLQRENVSAQQEIAQLRQEVAALRHQPGWSASGVRRH